MDGSANPDQESLVDSFVGVTSATRAEAIFFLESHNWALDAAIHSFYDNNSNPNSPAAATPIASVRGQEEQEQEQEQEEEDEQGDEDYVPPVELRRRSPPSPPQRVSGRSRGIMSSSSNSKKPARPSGSRPTIRTLADLNRHPSPGSDDDSDEPQEYYTGGEKSGMLVQDPTRGNHDVDAIFDRARRMGAMEGPFEPHAPSSSRSFIGTGRTLTGDTVQTAPQQSENIVHNIYFWSNGFSINDGPLRSFDDPENAAFLESIQKSECPKELAPADRRTAVHVNLMRREEKYPEPVKRQAAFQGVGRTLGSGSSSSNSQASESAAPMTAPSPSVGLFVDPALPTTSIQLRLADGTRMVAHFNHHHTIADIRAFIDASRPGAATTYQLQTVGFPPKQLTDLTQTIEQAGLTNSVVIQKV